MRYFFR